MSIPCIKTIVSMYSTYNDLPLKIFVYDVDSIVLEGCISYLSYWSSL